jgi:hypothetical protein
MIPAIDRHEQAVCRTSSVPVEGQPVLGADLNRSESGRLLATPVLGPRSLVGQTEKNSA